MEDPRSEAIKEFINNSYDRIYAHALCHYSAANKYAAYRTRLGIPSIILAAVTSAGVGMDAPSLMDVAESAEKGQTGIGLTIRVVMLSLLLCSGVLTSLMTFFNFEDLRNRHHESGKRYSSLLRKIETFKVRELGMGADELEQALTEISAQEQEVSNPAPPIPSKTYKRIHQQISLERQAQHEGILPDPSHRFRRLSAKK